METLIINVPENKSTLVKQILKGLGVAVSEATHLNTLSDYKQKLTQVAVWSDKDIAGLEEGKNAFENLKPEQW